MILTANTPVFICIGFWLKVIPKVKGLTFTLNSKVKWYLKRPILICIELRQKLITKVRGLTFTFEKVRQSDTERRPFSFALDSDWTDHKSEGSNFYFWKSIKLKVILNDAHFLLHRLPTESDHKSEGSDFYRKTPIFSCIWFRLKLITKLRCLTFTFEKLLKS